jgi:hypothetical protein
MYPVSMIPVALIALVYLSCFGELEVVIAGDRQELCRRNDFAMYFLDRRSLLVAMARPTGPRRKEPKTMYQPKPSRSFLLPALTLALALAFAFTPHRSLALSGGAETIRVSKCYTNATLTSYGQLLIKASSSNTSAHLYAYRPDGTYQGEVQNGGGSRYGGTVMGYLPYDPGYMIIVSSTGASVNAPTTPFQP